MTEPTPLEKKIALITDSNREIQSRINALGFETTNVRDNQVRFFIDFMVSIGSLTPEEKMDFTLRWETHLNDNLVSLEKKAKSSIEDMRKQQKEAHSADQRRLIAPPAPDLFIPGNSGRGRRIVRDKQPPTEC